MTGRQQVADGRDHLLVRAAQQGHADAFAQLVSAHRPWLVSLCRSLLSGDHHAAEDIAQECLVRLHSTLVHCPERELAVRPWLSVVARHACIDHVRRTQRQPVPVENLPERSSHDEDIFEVDPALAKAWSRLTPRHREALYHRELIGLSYDDIATLLDTTSAGVESVLVRARAALRREYRRAGGRLLGCGAFLGLERSVRGRNPHPEAVAHVARCRNCAQVLGEIERMAGLLRGAPLPPAPPTRTPWSVLHGGATRMGELLAPVAPMVSDLAHLTVAAGAALAIVSPLATTAPAGRPDLQPTVQSGVEQVVPGPARSPGSSASSTQVLPSPPPRPSWYQSPTSFPQPPWGPAQEGPTPTPWFTPAPLTVLSPQPHASERPPPTWNPTPSRSPNRYVPQQPTSPR
ncbi:MAG: sigma-70 family RNA polymerase sigma factor [Mycobacteriales bacterium]|nr:sigma-70 family RNA polymerase sigma factor [Mycobacteriales bacterium]